MDEMEKASLSKQFIETLLQVPVSICGADSEELEAALRQYIPDFLKSNFPFFISRSMAESFEFSVIYHIINFIGLNFELFVFPYGGENASEPGTKKQALITGPYLVGQPDQDFCEEILQKGGKSMSLLIPFYHYCQELPVVSKSSVTDAMRTALKAVAGEEKDFLYRYYSPQSTGNISEAEPTEVKAEEAAMMEMLEQRYQFEKLMLQEVQQGNTKQAMEYYTKFSHASRSIVRTADPIRTTKNLGFSLNTMLRKSAEQAGIHPIYLDIISTNFAMLIENAGSTEELDDIKTHMIGAYCRFVQKQRLDQYSPLVRKAVTYLQVHLAESLTLNNVARGIKVSPSYLSRIFNQEVKESLSNYITRTRIEKAAQLLSFSQMSIQNIAFYVGFNNLNYFSRCFKKYESMTPTEYRSRTTLGA